MWNVYKSQVLSVSKILATGSKPTARNGWPNNSKIFIFTDKGTVREGT